MSGFGTEPAALFAVAARAASAAEDGATALAVTTASAEDLFGAAWTGGAASAVGEAFAEWQRGARVMLQALERLADAIGSAGRDYALAESASRGALERLLP